MTKKTKGSTETTGPKLVQDLADILEASALSELEYATDDVSIRLSRGMTSTAAAMPVMTPAPPAPAPATSPVADASPDHPGTVIAPMVGTAYLSPEPNADTFIKVGDNVSAGQTLLIIEAMKVMNPIAAPTAGVIKAILVGDAQPVEYGQGLVIIE